jgi:hypothetical protein
MAGCSDDLAPASRLDDLRLLAVEADRPAAAPGERVTLRALFSNADAQALSWGYAFCDGARSSAALDCLRAIDLETLAIFPDRPEFSFEMPEPTTGGERPVSVGVVVVLCPGEIARGTTHGIPLSCRVDGQPLDLNDFELGVKRIYYADAHPNQNPQIAQITFDGEPWPEGEIKTVAPCPRDSDEVEKCKPAFRHTFVVEAEEGAVETFADNDGRAVREQVVLQFYATGGTFEFDVRTIDAARTRFVARQRDAGRTLTLHFVVRDSRGGVSWKTRAIAVE